MKRTLMGMIAAVTMSVAFVAAQAPQTPPSASGGYDKASAAQEKSDKAMTWAGCLEAGSAPGTYVLNNASEVKGGSASSEPKAATNPQAGASATAAASASESFKISGSPVGFDLANNLNHKVQVTGTVAESASATAKAEPAPAGAVAMKTITVRSAKSIADRCMDLSR